MIYFVNQNHAKIKIILQRYRRIYKNNAKIKIILQRTKADQGSHRAIQADQGNFNSQLKMILQRYRRIYSGNGTILQKGLKKGI